MHKLINFGSGLRMVYVPMRNLRSVTVGVWAGAGSVCETEKDSGISHFAEHMLFKGTKSRSAFEIADYVDSLGAQINAFTSKECTCYYTKSIDEHAEKCCEILSDLYFNSTFPEEELAREKGVVCEEILMVEDTPEDLCHELLASAFFDGHPLGRPILGTSQNVNSFTAANLRDYLSRFYTADNTVLVFCGNIDETRACELAQKYFADNFRFFCADRRPINTICPKPACITRQKDIEQANLAIAFPSFGLNTPETYPLSILSNILGGCMSSRLFQRVREQLGLCYSVYTFPSAYLKNGAFNIFTATAPATATAAVSAIVEELDKLKAHGIKDDEFARGKEQIKSAMILSQESTQSTMNAYGKLMTVFGELFDIDTRIAHINSLTLDDVNAIIPQIIDFGRASTAYVGRNADCNTFEIFKSRSLI